MTQSEKDMYYLNIAEVVASRSTCLFGNVGCVIVDKDDNVISTGYLADRRNILNCRKRKCCSYAEREHVKVCFGIPEHCDYMFPEVSAILAAERSRLQGSTLYLYAKNIITNEYVDVQLHSTLSKIIDTARIKRIVMKKQEKIDAT